MSKEHPILFSTPMVKAILAGKKTMTRRVVKLDGWCGDPLYETKDGDLVDVETMCPYGQVGDHLWVRETWHTMAIYDNLSPKDVKLNSPIWYKDTYGDSPTNCSDDKGKQRPSIFMPRRASRITLEITGIRVERVQDVRNNKDNWIAEGFSKPFEGTISWTMEADQWFYELWDSINAQRGYSWESNPWVWVIEFKRV